MIMKTKLIPILLAVLFCACLTSCGEDLDVTTEIKYSVYEHEGSDMVSFYLTADTDAESDWSYSLSELTALEVYHKTAESEQNAAYTTIIFKPKAEGEDILTFNLENGGECQYLVKTAKDESGIIRITVAVKKYALVSR